MDEPTARDHRADRWVRTLILVVQSAQGLSRRIGSAVVGVVAMVTTIGWMLSLGGGTAARRSTGRTLMEPSLR